MANRDLRDAETLAAALDGALEANLVSLLVYGAAVRGAARPDAGAPELLLIVADASTAALRPAADALARWVRAGHAPPLIFSEAEWRGSADVFPIEVEDIREAHRLLRGRDPFAGLSTRKAELRAELERELRGKLLRLRAEYAAAAADGRRLEELLEQSAGTFAVLLRATLRLAGRTPSGDGDRLAEDAAAVAGCDPAGLAWALARRAGRKVVRLQPFDPLAVRYVEAIERLAGFVDALTVDG